jgi:acetoin:2,6-dichlorophenolindophenol oxidoreductase subunit alpha
VRARRGAGPTLIEAKTYRFDEHNVGLFVAGEPYRSREEVEYHRTHRDPLPLFRRALLASGIEADVLANIESEVAATVTEAIEFAEASPFPDTAALYDYLYSNPIGRPSATPIR